MPSLCAISTCPNNSRKTDKSISYHSFPKNAKIRKQWIIACKRGDSSFNPNNSRICSEHFCDEDYKTDLQAELLGYVPRRKFLKEEAVPHKKLTALFRNQTNAASCTEVTSRQNGIRKRELNRINEISPKKKKIYDKVTLKHKDICPKYEKQGKSAKDRKNDKSFVSNDMVELEISELKGVDKLVADLKKLLTDKKSCDVVLKVEDSEFKAHKSILIARSPIFGSMFRHDTEESVTGKVNIPDCSATGFESFLLYLYTGNVDVISSENVHNLYQVADKYLIEDLKSACVKYMEENLSVENVCAVMTLTTQYSELGLLEKAATFFCDNVKEMVKTVQWKKYLKNYPIQANELLNA